MVPNSKSESMVLPSKTGGTVLSPPLSALPLRQTGSGGSRTPRPFAGRRRVYQTGKPVDRPATPTVNYKNLKDPAPGYGPVNLPDGKQKVRVVVIGGLEEIGRNCTLIEYGNDIILLT